MLKEGGLFDNLLNKGEIPTVKVAVDKETLIQLGLTIVISVTIVILVNALLKTLLGK